MAKYTNLLIAITILIISFTLAASSQENAATSAPGCQSESAADECHNKSKALYLKIVAIVAILITSFIGVALPQLAPKIPALQPDKDAFVLVKALSSGVILATGYMHVLPDSIDDLTSECLPKVPWRSFPVSTCVAMFSAIATLMLDSFMLGNNIKKHGKSGSVEHGDGTLESGVKEVQNADYDEITIEEEEPDKEEKSQQLKKYQVIAQVLEAGIIVHSVVIGLAMGTSENHCTIKPLIIAICFHQLFEGMGLGGCILQAEFSRRKQVILVFFFASTTPMGLGLGMALTNYYSETSPTALIVVGLLNACSAGLLNYMALVDLLAHDFLGPRLLGRVWLQIKAFLAVIAGAIGMSVMAIWA